MMALLRMISLVLYFFYSFILVANANLLNFMDSSDCLCSESHTLSSINGSSVLLEKTHLELIRRQTCAAGYGYCTSTSRSFITYIYLRA
jgi:hypothetical protein